VFDPIAAHEASPGPMSVPPAGHGLSLRQWAVINIALAGLLMILGGGTPLPTLVGAVTVVLAAATGALNAWRRVMTIGSGRPHRGILDLLLAYDILLTWFPGFVALCLAALAVVALTLWPDDAWLRLGAIAMFAYQIGVIAALDDLSGLERATANRHT